MTQNDSGKGLIWKPLTLRTHYGFFQNVARIEISSFVILFFFIKTGNALRASRHFIKNLVLPVFLFFVQERVMKAKNINMKDSRTSFGFPNRVVNCSHEK